MTQISLGGLRLSVRGRILGLAALATLMAGCGSDEDLVLSSNDEIAGDTPLAEGREVARVSFSSGHLSALWDSVVTIPEPSNLSSSSNSGEWAALDWNVLGQKVRWAEAMRLDTLEFGEAVSEMGRTFVGWTYTPQTLEVGDFEHTVVNLRELDCVTFIENVLALVRFQRRFGAQLLSDGDAARSQYEALLEEIRYRGGVLDGYSSRLHYFSDWLSDNELRGGVAIRSGALGTWTDDEPIDFMSTHPDAYPRLSSAAAVAEIAEIEAELNLHSRAFIPQDEIAAIANEIREGDIIAATSTVAGLDIAHTGIAIWEDGALHLLHAPLVGRNVEISELPLADRILEIRGQDGIMVATPLPGHR